MACSKAMFAKRAHCRWGRAVLGLALLGLAGACGDPGPIECSHPAERPPPFGEAARRVRVLRSIPVRAFPHEAAPHLGALAANVRLTFGRTVQGPGCDAWIEVEPAGWICATDVEPTGGAPWAPELPRLAGQNLLPGEYAKVLASAAVYPGLREARRGEGGERPASALSVRRRREVRLARRPAWQTTDGRVVETRRLRVHTPSAFTGVDLTASDAPRLPFAWVSARRNRSVAAEAGEAVCAQGGLTLVPRSGHEVLGLSEDGTLAQLEGEGWAPTRDLRLAAPAPRPEEVGPEERWIDVDLSQQVLVAYQGDRPIYATLISGGAEASRTPKGIHRIWVKLAEKTMRGTSRRGSYEVAEVPWTLFFDGNYGLHAAYWHDGFGEPRSSGCINLSPRDARWLYHWSDPQVPGGWTAVYANAYTPGSVVRIR